jgi:hypothetical protein
MKKKAYLRTIEVAIAVILTFIVAYFIFPRAATPQEENRLSVLPVLEQNPEFRDCVVTINYSCTEAFLRDYVPLNYDFVYDITEDPETGHANLPQKNIYPESVYIAGSSQINLYNPKIVKLYYWRKE